MDEQDFESTTSTNSITPANTGHIIQETPPICKSKISQQTSKRAVKGDLAPGYCFFLTQHPAARHAGLSVRRKRIRQKTVSVNCQNSSASVK